ncbi:MAG TPA: GNAT family N-acetyltransferase, partial [Ktedonobacteraceae bacterium]|nr:GNAT family N-acetyltransferase [Ktedonobacteraceae bacterium]
MSLTVEILTEAELDAANEVIKAAYNNPHGRAETLRRYLALQPDGTCVVKYDGQVVGFGGAIHYGAFAYIGMMSVHPAMQRRGIGQVIMDYLLDWLDRRACPTILLDATPAGRPLYERCGFIEKDTTVVLRYTQVEMPAQTASEQVYKANASDLPELIAFDAPAFGAERRALLAAYYADDPRRVLIARDANGRLNGYLIAQQSVIGPWVARGAADAERLLLRALALPFDDHPRVFVSQHNTAALQLLARHGFTQQRTLSHMRRGEHIQRSRHTMIYGQTSLGFG